MPMDSTRYHHSTPDEFFRTVFAQKNHSMPQFLHTSSPQYICIYVTSSKQKEWWNALQVAKSFPDTIPMQKTFISL